MKQIILLFTLYALYLPLRGQDSISITIDSDTIIQFPLTSECIYDGLPLRYDYPFEIVNRQVNSLTMIITIAKNCGQTTTIDLIRRHDSIFISQTDTGLLTTCGCFQPFTLTVNKINPPIYLRISNSFNGYSENLFETEDISWIELKETGDDITPPTVTIEKYFLNGDTTINEKKYTKICRNIEEDIHFIGGFREENRSIFYTGCDYHWLPTNNEVLLYDFDLAIDDTVYTGTWHWNIVENKDSILIGNDYRSRYYLDDGQQWIEGIGSTYGFLYPMTDIPTCNWKSKLICFINNGDTIYWNSDFPNDYLKSVTKSQNHVSSNRIKVFPNIVNAGSPIYIYLDKLRTTSIKLFNISGREIKEFINTGKNTIQINIPESLSGLYILSIQDSKGYITNQKIIVN